jgi:hypothetical protein
MKPSALPMSCSAPSYIGRGQSIVDLRLEHTGVKTSFTIALQEFRIRFGVWLTLTAEFQPV